MMSHTEGDGKRVSSHRADVTGVVATLLRAGTRCISILMHLSLSLSLSWRGWLSARSEFRRGSATRPGDGRREGHPRALRASASGCLVSLGALLGALLLSGAPALGAGDVNAAVCPNEGSPGFRAGLPDCRAYEMVTPSNKNGAAVEYPAEPTVAADGSSLAGRSWEAFGGSVGGEVTDGDFYRFTRGASGWVTAALNPEDGRLLSLGVGDSVWGPAEREHPASANRLRLRAADGSLSEIGPGEGYPEVVDVGGISFLPGAAAEAVNGVLLTADKDALPWPFDSTVSGGSLYEYRGTGNTAPTLVGVSGGVGSTALISQCGTTTGGQNVMSEDGSVVFFTAVGADSSDCGGTEPPVNELFARIDEERTVAISEPSVVDCSSCDTGTPVDASFRGASADGSKVFFTTTQPLLGSDTSENLYEYDFDPPAGQPKVVRVSAGDGSVSGPVAEVQGVTNVSEDGSHVYFIARGVLTTAANSAGERAQEGGETSMCGSVTRNTLPVVLCSSRGVGVAAGR
jgi:hypothetical protein